MFFVEETRGLASTSCKSRPCPLRLKINDQKRMDMIFRGTLFNYSLMFYIMFDRLFTATLQPGTSWLESENDVRNGKRRMPGKLLRKEIKGFWFQYLDMLRVWLISLSISIDICYLNLLSLCFPIIFHSTSSPESLRVLKK